MCKDCGDMNKEGRYNKSRIICYRYMYTLGSLVLREN